MIRALRTIFLDVLKWHVCNVDIVAELLGAFEQAVLLSVWRLVDKAFERSILRGVQSALERQIAAGAVYATIDRLEQKRLVDSRLEEGTAVRVGRARRFYRLTARGISALNESKSTLESIYGVEPSGHWGQGRDSTLTAVLSRTNHYVFPARPGSRNDFRRFIRRILARASPACRVPASEHLVRAPSDQLFVDPQFRRSPDESRSDVHLAVHCWYRLLAGGNGADP